jgi:hypothetical protein
MSGPHLLLNLDPWPIRAVLRSWLGPETEAHYFGTATFRRAGEVLLVDGLRGPEIAYAGLARLVLEAARDWCGVPVTRWRCPQVRVPPPPPALGPEPDFPDALPTTPRALPAAAIRLLAPAWAADYLARAHLEWSPRQRRLFVYETRVPPGRRPPLAAALRRLATTFGYPTEAIYFVEDDADVGENPAPLPAGSRGGDAAG